MTIRDICTKTVVVVEKNDPLQRIAHLMKDSNVGNVLVIEGQGKDRLPVGIITDRDLVIEVLNRGVEISHLHAADVMSTNISTVLGDLDVLECLEKMQASGVRRAPVVNKEGHLEGIISIDDLVLHLSKEATSVAKVLSNGN